MDIERPKSSRNGRRSRSAGRSPRTEPKSFDKRGRPEGGRFSKLKLMHRSSRVHPWKGPIHFVRKLLMFCLNGLYFWLGTIYKLFKSHVNYALMWILRILGSIKFCKGPIKISNGPLKFGDLHVFELDMGHWPILRAHHHFGLG